MNKDIAAFNIAENTVCISMTISRPGTTRKVDTSMITVDADKSKLSARKWLLDSDEYDAIATHDGITRKWLNRRALPSLFRSGIFLLPVKLIDEVDDELTKRNSERMTLVEDFLAILPDLIEKDRADLGSLFNPRDYLTPEQMRQEFKMQWRYIALNVPETLKGISANFFQREKEKAEQMWAQAFDECRTILRVNMAEFVQHITDRLTPDTKGNRKKFHSTMTENLREFLDYFDKRNVTNDVELSLLVKKARTLIAGVDVDMLKDSENLREKVRSGFAAIKEECDRMVVEVGSRAIAMDGDL